MQIRDHPWQQPGTYVRTRISNPPLESPRGTCDKREPSAPTGAIIVIGIAAVLLLQSTEILDKPATVLGTTRLRPPSVAFDMAFSSNERMALCTGPSFAGPKIRVFDLTTNELVRGVDALTDQTTIGASFDPSGKHLVAVHTTENKYGFRVLDVVSGQTTFQGAGMALGFNSEGDVITASATEPGLESLLNESKFSLTAVGKDGPLATTTVARGHLGSCHLDPTGRRLFLIDTDKTVRVRTLDAGSLEALSEFELPALPQGARPGVATVGQSTDLLVRAGQKLWQFSADGKRTRELTGDGRIIVTADPFRPRAIVRGLSAAGAVVLDLRTGEQRECSAPLPSGRWAFTRSGRLGVLSSANTPRFFDVETGEELGDGHPTRAARTLQFCAGGKQLLSVGNRAFLWDVKDGAIRYTLPGSSEAARFSPDGKRIIRQMGDAVTVFDAERGNRISNVDLAGFSKRKEKVYRRKLIGDVSSDADLLAYVDQYQSARVISLSRQKTVFEWISEPTEKSPSGFQQYNGFDRIRFRPDTNEVVLQSEDWLAFKDRLTNNPARTHQINSVSSEWGKAMWFLDSDRVLVRMRPSPIVLTDDSRLGAFDCDSGKNLFEIHHRFETYNDVAVSPDGRVIICVGKLESDRKNGPFTDRVVVGGILRVCDASDGRTLARHVHSSPLLSVAISENTPLVAIGFRDTRIRVFTLDDLLPD